MCIDTELGEGRKKSVWASAGDTVLEIMGTFPFTRCAVRQDTWSQRVFNKVMENITK